MTSIRTAAALCAATFTAAACALPAASRTSSNGLALHVLDCGAITTSDMSAFTPGENEGRTLQLASTCYLVVHPQGTLMWDTGLADAIASQSGGVTNGAFHLTRARTLQSQLEAIGHPPSTIDYLAISHLHFDHAGNAGLFTAPTWLVQQNEYDAAFGSNPSAFDPSGFPTLRNNPKQLLNGDHDVFGDGSVMILSAPGHTIGHQVLLVNLPETGPVMLSGDLYHFRSNRERRIVPGFNHDRAMTLASFDRIEQIIRDRGAMLIIQHDVQDIGGLGELPVVLR